jgi:preprotein translocase subunit SecG
MTPLTPLQFVVCVVVALVIVVVILTTPDEGDGL